MIEVIGSAGVSLFEDDEIYHHVDDTFEWLAANRSELDFVIEQLDSRLRLGNAVGFTGVWRDHVTGGTFLIHPGAETISFTPSINRRFMVNATAYVDLGWYLERLVSSLSSLTLVGYKARDTCP